MQYHAELENFYLNSMSGGYQDASSISSNAKTIFIGIHLTDLMLLLCPGALEWLPLRFDTLPQPEFIEHFDTSAYMTAVKPVERIIIGEVLRLAADIVVKHKDGKEMKEIGVELDRLGFKFNSKRKIDLLDAARLGGIWYPRKMLSEHRKNQRDPNLRWF